jgi:hypothetical protein
LRALGRDTRVVVRQRSDLAGRVIGVVRLRGPFLEPIGLAEGPEQAKQVRVVGPELERAIELLRDDPDGILGHRAFVAMIDIREGGAPLRIGPGMSRVDRERLLEAGDCLLQLAVATIRQAEVVVIVGPLRVELDRRGELRGGRGARE